MCPSTDEVRFHYEPTTYLEQWIREREVMVTALGVFALIEELRQKVRGLGKVSSSQKIVGSIKCCQPRFFIPIPWEGVYYISCTATPLSPISLNRKIENGSPFSRRILVKYNVPEPFIC